MSSGQRFIKTAADILAVMLIISIVSGVGSAVLGVVGFIGIRESIDGVSDEMTNVEITQDISKIEFDIASASVYIKAADVFSCSTNNGNFLFTQKKGKLKIEEKNFKSLSGFGDPVIILYIPRNVTLKSFEFDCGSGPLSIEKLNCYSVDIDSGLGGVFVDNINVINNAEFDIGVGDFEMKSGTINNFKSSVGMGKADVKAAITGNNDIEVGIGALSIIVEKPISDYTIHVSSGLGKTVVAGEEISGSSTVGTGANIIELEGGIGDVEMSFAS